MYFALALLSSANYFLRFVSHGGEKKWAVNSIGYSRSVATIRNSPHPHHHLRWRVINSETMPSSSSLCPLVVVSILELLYIRTIAPFPFDTEYFCPLTSKNTHNIVEQKIVQQFSHNPFDQLMRPLIKIPHYLCIDMLRAEFRFNEPHGIR